MSSVRAVALASALLVGCGAPTQTLRTEPMTQTTKPTSGADPELLRQYAATYRFRLGQPTDITLLPDGSGALYLRTGPRSFVRDLFLFDVSSGREELLLSAGTLLAGSAETLTAEEKARRERMRLAARGIASFELSRDGERLLVPLSGRLFVVERRSRKVLELASEAGSPIDPQLSPDGTAVACVRDGEVYVTNIATGAERRLTHDAGGAVTNGLAEFVAQEEMDRMHGTFWSPDGQWLAYEQADTAGVDVFHIADPLHPEKAAQSWPYPRAGTPNARVRLGVVAAAGGDTTWIDWDHEKYPYLATVEWDKGGPLTLVVQRRDQREEQVLAADPNTGAVTTLLTETDAAWLNLDQDVPRWLESGEGFLWTTEREGAWQLELRGPDGVLVRPITKTSLGLRKLVDVDEDARMAYLIAGDEPTEAHIARVSLDGGEPVWLDHAAGEHSVVVSRGFTHYVDSNDGPDGLPTHTIRALPPDADNAVGTIPTTTEEPSITPNVELVKVGQDELRAAIVRPHAFDPSRRYPVLVHVYGGPHARMVTSSRTRYVLAQWFADNGFVVVSIDGHGTPGRGRAFERVIRGDLLTVPLFDQANAVLELADRYPELDVDRVGIFGWSFGGTFSAMAVMRSPDVFKVGIAGAPVTDWRLYDTHYTERYLGFPDEAGDAYDLSSPLTFAADLSRPLLLIHGTADDNVYFANTLALAKVLFEAGRPFDLLPLAGETHMVTTPELTVRLYSRIVDMLREHL